MEKETPKETVKSAKLVAVTFDEAYQALQAELKNIVRDTDNPFFNSKYVPLEVLLDEVKPILAKHNFTIRQYTSIAGGQVVLHTDLMHTPSAGGISSIYPVLPPKLDDPQKLGAALTYARRYQAFCVLGITATNEDDDGNVASAYTATDAIADLDGAKDLPMLQNTWRKIQSYQWDKKVLDGLVKHKDERKQALQ